MGGAQPLAVTMNGGVGARGRGGPAAHPAPPGHAVPRRARPTSSTRRWRASTMAARRRRRAPSGSRPTPPTCCRSCARAAWSPDVVTDQTSAHDALNGYVPNGMSLAEAGRAAPRESGRVRRRGRWRRWPCTCGRCWTLQARAGPSTFDYGNNIRAQAQKAGVADAFDIPGFVPEYIRPLFCEGKGPFRWAALSGDPADIAATDRLALEMFSRRRGAVPVDSAGRRARRVSGTARADLLARLRRARAVRPGDQRSGPPRRASRRRSSSAATTSTPDRWPRPTARQKGCAMAATPSPTGRC